MLGGNNGFAAQGTQGCGKRRKRQADGQTRFSLQKLCPMHLIPSVWFPLYVHHISSAAVKRFFLPSGGSCTCGRKKRQAASPNKGKDEPNTKWAEAYDAKKHLTQFQTGSLETCLVETIRTAAPVATARATTRVQATTTTRGSTMAARIRLVDANVIIARHSLTRMAGHTEGAEGRLSFLQSKREGIFSNFQSRRVWSYLVLHNWMG